MHIRNSILLLCVFMTLATTGCYSWLEKYFPGLIQKPGSAVVKEVEKPAPPLPFEGKIIVKEIKCYDKQHCKQFLVRLKTWPDGLGTDLVNNIINLYEKDSDLDKVEALIIKVEPGNYIIVEPTSEKKINVDKYGNVLDNLYELVITPRKQGPTTDGGGD